MYNPTLLVIKTGVCTVGSFLTGSLSLRNSKGHFGTGETFVFRLKDEMDAWKWSEEKQSRFIYADDSSLVVGDGALRIHSDLCNVGSTRSATFDSPPLFPTEISPIVVLEVWATTSDIGEI